LKRTTQTFIDLIINHGPNPIPIFFHVIVTARLAEGRMVILAVLPDRQKDTVIEN
jgi:hypothetical protein